MARGATENGTDLGVRWLNGTLFLRIGPLACFSINQLDVVNATSNLIIVSTTFLPPLPI